MNQHPLPQNVTTYQFRLIGDMTIQQFVYLSVGIGAAIFFYYTNLFSLIKWLFVALSAMSGFAVAFLPIEERPLDQWITNYLKAIYRPTRYIWHKGNEVPNYLTYTPTGALLPADAQEIARTAAIRKQQGLRSFLITLPQDQVSTIDAQEKTSFDNYLQLFSSSLQPPAAIDPTVFATRLNITADTPNSPSVPDAPDEAAPVVRPSAPNPTTPSGVVPLESVRVEPTPTAQAESSPVNDALTEAQPASGQISVADLTVPAAVAVTSSALPFPSTPTVPNTIVGMVMDTGGKIVDNAIIEVIDESGLPVRATKTNQLGQFFSTTPLKRGTYRLSVEKPGFRFDTIELVLSGQIVEPIKIQAAA